MIKLRVLCRSDGLISCTSAFSPLSSSEIDNEGVIEPDTDDPQEMGEFENVEVNRYASLDHPEMRVVYSSARNLSRI